MEVMIKTCAALLTCLQVISAQSFTDLMVNCQKNHIERFNECAVGAFKKELPRLINGVPEYGLPRTDPLILGPFNISQKQGPINFHADFNGLQVTGLKRLDLQYFDLNIRNGSVHFGGSVPSLTIRGKYNINGQVFQLPVQGTGPFLALVEGIMVEGYGVLSKRTRIVNKLDSINVGFKIRKFRSKVDNLYSGNEIMQNTFTHFIEQNSNMVLSELLPGLSRTFNELLTGVVNVILGQLPSEIITVPPNANRLDKHRARTIRVLAEMKMQ